MAAKDEPRRSAPFRDEKTVPSTGSRGEEDTHLLVFGRVTLSHPVTEGTTLTIGRSLEADLCLDDPSLSRLHARITVGAPGPGDPGLRIRDLGSSNGTRVGGELIKPEVDRPFHPGEPIGVGDCTILIQRGVRARRSQEVKINSDVIIEDESMRKLYELSGRIAASDLSVLLLGETGVGKEVFAKTIHERSPRSDKPFLALNCGAFSDELLESELFGHERGAFTGAVAAKVGLFETAKGGTVFLDEIGEMSPRTQVKLLRVIEERQVRPVGGLKTEPIDVRLIAATNRDLLEQVRRGEFREDLYYRLNGMVLMIPPLRKRPAEIASLARAFARTASIRAGGNGEVTLSEEAIRRLNEHPWPGNVRELKNVVERAVVLSNGTSVGAEHLPMARQPGANTTTPDRPPPQREPLKNAIEELERERILQALKECGGNQSQAAKLLGMSRKTFVRRLDQYNITRPRKGRDDES
jgi:two-component system, NtrC family, response regulator AtoC